LSRVIWAVILITLGLPGTSIFALKFAFIGVLSLCSVVQTMLFGFIMLVLVPIALIRIWLPVMCGQSKVSRGSLALTRLELALVGSCIVLGLTFGIVPSVLIA